MPFGRYTCGVRCSLVLSHVHSDSQIRVVYSMARSVTHCVRWGSLTPGKGEIWESSPTAKTCNCKLLLPPGEQKGSDSTYCPFTLVLIYSHLLTDHLSNEMLMTRFIIVIIHVSYWYICNHKRHAVATTLIFLCSTEDWVLLSIWTNHNG